MSLWHKALRAFVRATKLMFVLMLVMIPIPIANLFNKVLSPRKRAEAAEVLRKEDEER